MEKNTQELLRHCIVVRMILFYAIVNVPMTENNQSVSSVTKNITDIKEQTIVKCIILLYPAEGINEQGDIDDQGYVKIWKI